MSALPLGVTLAQAAAQNLLSPAIIWQRNIAGFVADVTVEEHHRDELVVTENPVEQGAAITDHAFKKPARVTLRVGYSNSSLASLGDTTYVQDWYAQFLALQAGRAPFNVLTGKRSYTNMLMTSIETMTDEKWENASLFTVECREIILVTTQTVSVPPSANMKAPGINGATQNNGTSSLAPATNYNAAAAP